MLNLAMCRRALWPHGSNVALQTASVADLEAFKYRLNQVCERFFSLGTWRSMWRILRLTIYDSSLTLPRGFDTCRSIEHVCGPSPIYSQFHQFVGHGTFASWHGHGSRGLRLIDETAQTFRNPRGTYTLRVIGTETVSPGVTFRGGVDQDGNELFSDVVVQILDGVNETTQQYTQLPYIEKSVTVNPVSIYAVDTTTAVATLIAVYAPGEKMPAYRKYRVDISDGQVVRAICKLSFVPAVADADLIVPSHIGALKLGLMGLSFEDKVDPANCALYFGPNFPSHTGKMTGAIDLLDAELNELEQGEQPVFQTVSDWGAGSVRNVR